MSCVKPRPYKHMKVKYIHATLCAFKCRLAQKLVVEHVTVYTHTLAREKARGESSIHTMAVGKSVVWRYSVAVVALLVIVATCKLSVHAQSYYPKFRAQYA